MKETLYYAKVNKKNVLLLESRSSGGRCILENFKDLEERYPRYKGNLYTLVDGVEITIEWKILSLN